MSLQPCPQVLDRVEIGCVWRQKGNLDFAVDRVKIVANHPASMRLQTIPYHQQRLPQLRPERFEESHNLFLLDAALVQPEQDIASSHSSDHRNVIPIEMKLDHGRLALGGPGTHPSRSFAQARLIDKNDQTALAFGFFLSAGHVRRFQSCTASSLRSMARFSGFCGLKPKAPRMRQICVLP